MSNKCSRGLSGNLPGNLIFGVPGKSAYEYAVDAGYTGTEEEFAKKLAQQGGAVDEATVQQIVDDYLAANPPAPGDPGASAYEIAVANGFEGSEAEWLESLHGKDGYTPVKGVDYVDGKDGYTPVKGTDYNDGTDGKSAYEYAQDGGYTGTEEEFSAKLAEDSTFVVTFTMNDDWTEATADKTLEEIIEKFNNGAMIRGVDAYGNVYTFEGIGNEDDDYPALFSVTQLSTVGGGGVPDTAYPDGKMSIAMWPYGRNSVGYRDYFVADKYNVFDLAFTSDRGIVFLAKKYKRWRLQLDDAANPVLVALDDGTTKVAPTISTASVGQTIVVKAVDDNGKPTEWEAADLPAALPTVTASDNGAFLRAVDGAWAAVQLTDVSTEGA